MIEFLFRRVINNKWLFISLIIGVVSACAVFSSIPMYSNAILQKVLTNNLEDYYTSNGSYPTEFRVIYNNLYKPIANQKTELIKLEKIVDKELVSAYGLPEKSRVKTVRYTRLVLKNRKDFGTGNDKLASMLSLSDIQKHINIQSGKAPDNNSGKDIYEVIVSEEAIQKLHLLINEVYEIYLPDFLSSDQAIVMKIKVVGVFSVKEDNDYYWSKDRLSEISDSIIIDDKVSRVLYGSEDISFTKIQWDYILDYTKIRVQNVSSIMDTYDSQLRWVQRNQNAVNIDTPLKKVLEGYENRENQLRATMIILFIPLLILLGLYSHLISDIIVKNESNEIAILKSRGASTIQVFANYVIQSLFIFAIAAASGIILALLLCQVLGSANGFLEFVNREALDVKINFEAILYSIAGGVLFMLFILIPSLKASKVSILQYKQNKIKANTKPLWQKLYLDIFFIGVSLYGLYRFKSNQRILSTTGISEMNIGIDPLLYFIAAFFILGVSLLLLRIYPLIIEMVFRVGKRFWSSVLYLVLVNVSRSEKNSQVIMLFLILSLSFGIMNANHARTINSNMEDRIMYSNGADVVVKPYNMVNHSNENGKSFTGAELSSINMSESNTDNKGACYEGFMDIKGIERMTRVFVNDNSSLSFGSEDTSGLRVMGVNPYEFGQISWFRSGLLPYHINTYLNALTSSPGVVFLSSNIKKNLNIKVGDTVKIKINDNNELPVVVCGFIDYFPSCNPYMESSRSGKSSSEIRSFAILNYSYIEKRIPSISYEIWMKKNADTSDNEIYKELISKKLMYEKIQFTNIDIIKQKNDPILQGTNGVLTMCFIITMLISFIGYMIFWILSLKDKALKFGLSRAIGMSMKGITMVITLEQLLVSGFAIVIGILVGSISSSVFIPMLIMPYSSAVQVPPFRVIELQSDYIRLIIISLIMLVSAIAILNALIKRIKVHRILKLGED